MAEMSRAGGAAINLEEAGPVSRRLTAMCAAGGGVGYVPARKYYLFLFNRMNRDAPYAAGAATSVWELNSGKTLNTSSAYLTFPNGAETCTP